MNLIALDNVSFAYGRGRTILDGVSLSLSPGQVTVIVGPSWATEATRAPSMVVRL